MPWGFQKDNNIKRDLCHQMRVFFFKLHLKCFTLVILATSLNRTQKQITQLFVFWFCWTTNCQKFIFIIAVVVIIYNHYTAKPPTNQNVSLHPKQKKKKKQYLMASVVCYYPAGNRTFYTIFVGIFLVIVFCLV